MKHIKHKWERHEGTTASEMVKSQHEETKMDSEKEMKNDQKHQNEIKGKPYKIMKELNSTQKVANETITETK